MATSSKPRFVDTGNPALAIDCPHCGLLTARFAQYCRNCGYSLWPNGEVAAAAFRAWRDAEPGREYARQFDLTMPQRAPWEPEVPELDYDERAHELGIHVSPPSRFPILICLGMLFMALAAPPWKPAIRIALGVIGVVIFLIGVAGWVVFEDTRMYMQAAGGAHVVHGGHSEEPE